MSWTGNGEFFTDSVMTMFCGSTTATPNMRLPLVEFQILFLGDLAVALERVGDELGELFGRVRGRLDPLGAKALDHVRTLCGSGHRSVELVYDRARRPCRRHQSDPPRRLRRRQAGVDQGRDLGQARRALLAGNGNRLDLARLDLRHHAGNRPEVELGLVAHGGNHCRRTALVWQMHRVLADAGGAYE